MERILVWKALQPSHSCVETGDRSQQLRGKVGRPLLEEDTHPPAVYQEAVNPDLTKEVNLPKPEMEEADTPSWKDPAGGTDLMEF